MPHLNIASLTSELQRRLKEGLEDSIPVIEERIPIDTQRAYTTIRVEPTEDYNIQRLTVGGKAVSGVLRERGIIKPVDYAVYIESKYGFLAQSVPEIVDNIEKAFK